MANKVAIGAASLAVAGYYLSENLKDRAARVEEEERRQRLEDQMMMEREARRKKQHEKKQNVEDHGSGPSLVGEIESELMILLERVRDEARKERRNLSSSLSLPLLSAAAERNEINEVSEIVLAASLAFGSDDLTWRVLNDVIADASPGLALAKLSNRSINFIARLFESHQSASPVKSFNHVFPFWLMVQQNKDRQEPTVISFETSNDEDEVDQIVALAEQLNLELLPESGFDAMPALGKLSYNRNNLYSILPGESVLLMNFRGGFRVKARKHEGQLCSMTRVYENGTKIIVEPMPSNRRFHLLEVPREAGQKLVANFVAVRAASIAAERLFQLSQESGRSGVSLEHVMVACGEARLQLKEMASNELGLLESSESAIVPTLVSKLEELVPSPDIPEDSEDDTVTQALKDEIAVFVEKYIALLKHSYSEIPRLKGSPPSQCVKNRATVWGEAAADFFREEPPMVQRSRRMLEVWERDRIVQSRKLCSPGRVYTAIFLATFWVSVFFLAYCAVVHFLPVVSRGVRGRAISFLLSLLLSFWTVSSTLEMLAPPLRVENTSTKIDLIWNASNVIVEILVRKVSLALWHSEPFARRIASLRSFCEQQHGDWLLRMCRKEYYNCLRRKIISTAGVDLLLAAFSEKSEAQGVEGGIFPGSFEDAEAFLQVEVEDDDTSIGEDAEISTKLLAFGNVARLVDSCLSLLPGDLVEVDHKFICELIPGKFCFKQEKRTATVVSVSSSWISVQFDDETEQCEVPSSDCQLLKRANTGMLKDVAESEPTPFNLQHDQNEVDSGEDVVMDSVEPLSEDKNVDFGSSQKRTHKNDKQQTFAAVFEGGKWNQHHVNAEGGEELAAIRVGTLGEDGNMDSGPNRKRKHRTVAEVLREGGWKLVRKKKHLCYRRFVVCAQGGNLQKQNFTMAKTPSDSRHAEKNAMSTLGRLDQEGDVVAATPEQNTYTCSLCFAAKEKNAFSRNQIRKGTLKCKECTAELQ